MRIGVTGARGRLGSELVRHGCIPIYTDIRALTRLDVKSFDVIIHCAAMTDVDGCEEQISMAGNINVGGTKHLINSSDTKIVYISTDYIFDGQDGPYSETDKPNPINIYGWSKLGGEIVVRNASSDHLIIRTTVLFDKYSDNFVTSVARQLHNNQQLELPLLYGSPTYVPHLAKGILQAVEFGLSGVINITGNQVISRYQLGRKIASIMDKKLELVQPANGAIGNAKRPLTLGLLTTKAESLGISIYDPIEGIKEVVNALETMDYRRPDNSKSDSLERHGNRVLA